MHTIRYNEHEMSYDVLDKTGDLTYRAFVWPNKYGRPDRLAAAQEAQCMWLTLQLRNANRENANVRSE